jgi:hypothetical protein
LMIHHQQGCVFSGYLFCEWAGRSVHKRSFLSEKNT